MAEYAIDANSLGNEFKLRPGSWVFETLWKTAAERRVQLNVPDTILFYNGVPRKWLATQNRVLVQRSLPLGPSLADGGAVQKHTAADQASHLASCFAAIRSGISSFLQSVQTPIATDAPFCLAWFRDGRQEILKLGDFDRLKQEVMWTAEVAALQPYTEAQSTHIGLFRRQKVRTGFDKTRQTVMGEWVDGNLVDVQALLGDSDMHSEIGARRPGPEEVNVALDGVTDRLAHALSASYSFSGVDTGSSIVIDGGFSIQAPEDAGATYSARSTESGLGVTEPPTCKQRVISLAAHFYTSVDGRLWLGHVSSVYTIAQRQPQAVTEDPGNQDAGLEILQIAAKEAVRTADEAESDLRGLIVEGLAHNLDYGQQFSHFDVDTEGQIDQQQFSQGMQELGIDLPPAPLMVLWDRFVKNDTGHVTLQGFVAFFESGASGGLRNGTALDRLQYSRQPASSQAERAQVEGFLPASMHIEEVSDQDLLRTSDSDMDELEALYGTAEDMRLNASRRKAKGRVRHFGGGTWEGEEQGNLLDATAAEQRIFDVALQNLEEMEKDEFLRQRAKVDPKARQQAKKLHRKRLQDIKQRGVRLRTERKQALDGVLRFRPKRSAKSESKVLDLRAPSSGKSMQELYGGSLGDEIIDRQLNMTVIPLPGADGDSGDSSWEDEAGDFEQTQKKRMRSITRKMQLARSRSKQVRRAAVEANRRADGPEAVYNAMVTAESGSRLRAIQGIRKSRQSEKSVPREFIRPKSIVEAYIGSLEMHGFNRISSEWVDALSSVDGELKTPSIGSAFFDLPGVPRDLRSSLSSASSGGDFASGQSGLWTLPQRIGVGRSSTFSRPQVWEPVQSSAGHATSGLFPHFKPGVTTGPGLDSPSKASVSTSPSRKQRKIPFERFWFDDDTCLIYTVLKGPGIRPGETSLPYKTGRPVDFLYVPGLFEDISGLRGKFESLVSSLPGSRLMIVHYPGLAGTTWSEHPHEQADHMQGTLSAMETNQTIIKDGLGNTKRRCKALSTTKDGFEASKAPDRTTRPNGGAEGAGKRKWLTVNRLAIAVAACLTHARLRGEWGPSCAQDVIGRKQARAKNALGRDCVLMGSGFGGHLTSVLAADILGQRSSTKGNKVIAKQDRIIASAVRAVILINSFAQVDAELSLVLERISLTHGPLAALAGVVDSNRAEDAPLGAFTAGIPRAARRSSHIAPKGAPGTASGVVFAEAGSDLASTAASMGTYTSTAGVTTLDKFHLDGKSVATKIAMTKADRALRESIGVKFRRGIYNEQATKPKSRGWGRLSAASKSISLGRSLSSSQSAAEAGPADTGSMEELEAARAVRRDVIRLHESILFSPQYKQEIGASFALAELWELNWSLGDADPFLDYGIARLSEATYRHSKDLKATLAACPFPVLLIAGTEDAFVLPNHSVDICSMRKRAQARARGQDEDGDAPLDSPENWSTFLEESSRPLHPKVQANFVDVPAGMGLADFEALCKSVADDGAEEETIADAAAADEAELLKSIPRHKRLPTQRLKSGRVVRVEDSVSDSAILGARPTFTAFLQGGHCLLQERTDDVLNIVEKVILGHAGGLSSAGGYGLLAKEMVVQDAEILPPLLAPAYGVGTASSPKPAQQAHSVAVAKSAPDKSAAQDPQQVSRQQAKLQQQLRQRGIDFHGTELEMLAVLSEVMDNEDALNRQKAALAVPKEKRKQIENKRRLARLKAMYKEKQRQAARQGNQLTLEEAQTVVDRELEQEAKTKLNRLLMQREDERSDKLREYESELAQRSIEDASVQAKLKELRSGLVSGAPATVDAVTETVEADARASAMRAVKNKMDKSRSRADKTKEAAESLEVQLLGEAAGGYFIESESVQDLSVGSHRLLNDAATLRSRKKAALRRWRRIDDRIKIIESELSKVKADLILNQRAAVAVRRERDALRRALSKHGQMQDKSSSIIKTLEDELFEISVRRDASKRTQQSLVEQLEVSIAEMDQIGSKAHALVAKAKHVEDTLVQFRLAVSQRISSLRDSRANMLKRKELSLKQARESSSNVGRLRRRLKELVVEFKRAKAVKGKYVDTYFFHAGYSQRVEAVVLRKHLRAEVKKVKQNRRECQDLVVEASRVSASSDATAVAAAEETGTLGRILAQIVESISSAPPYADDLKEELALDEHDEAIADDKVRDVAEAVGVDSERLQSMPRRERNLVWRAAQLNILRELNIFCEAIVRAEDSASLTELGAEFASPAVPSAFLDMPEVVKALKAVLGGTKKLRDDSKLRLITRWKAADDRSAEERQFVALDRKLNPGFYAKLGAEELKLLDADALYRSPWPVDVLKQVLSLPCSPAMALSAMSSPEHLNIHKLLAKFSHGYGEEAERLRDMALGAKSVACAAVSRGFAARTKAPSMRSAEEQDWVSLDCIYRPHLYINPEDMNTMDASIAESISSLPETAKSRSCRRPLEHEDLHNSMSGLSTEESVIIDAVNGSLSDSELMSGASVRHRLLTAKRLKDSIMFEASVEEQRAAGQGQRPAWEHGLGPSPRFNPALETDLFSMPKRRHSRHEGQELTPRDAKSMFYRLMRHKFRRERRKKAELARKKQNKKLNWLKRQALIQAKQLEVAEARVLGGVAVGDIRRRAHFARPPPGEIALHYDQQTLHKILWMKPSQLTSARDRRVQMLLRAYGSDGGYALARLVSSHSTPVVYGIPEIADAQKLLAEELREAGEVSVLDELAYADADGSRENVAAVAVGSAQGCVLVRSAKSLVLLDVKNASLQPGSTQEHVFDVPGSLSDVLAFGPRGWDGIPPAVAKLMGPEVVPDDVVGQPGSITRGQMLSAQMRGTTRIGGGVDDLQDEFRPPSSSSNIQFLQGELPTHRPQTGLIHAHVQLTEPVDPLTAAQQFNQRLATANMHTDLPSHPLERVAFETAGGAATTHLLGQDGPLSLPYVVRYEHRPAVRPMTQNALPSTAAGSSIRTHTLVSGQHPQTAWTSASTLANENGIQQGGMVIGAHSDQASAGQAALGSMHGAEATNQVEIVPTVPFGLGPVSWTELGAEPLHHDVRRELAGSEDPSETFKREIRKQKLQEEAERAARASGKPVQVDLQEDEADILINDFERETGCPGVRPMIADLTATITFHGAFSGKSAAYVLAKVQAALYREAFCRLEDVPSDYHNEPGVAAPENPHDFHAASRSASALGSRATGLFSTETPRTDRTVLGAEPNQSRQASRGINTRGAAAYSAPSGGFQSARPSARSSITPRDHSAAGALSRGELAMSANAKTWITSKPGSALHGSIGRHEAGALFATHGQIPFTPEDPFTVKAWEDPDGDLVHLSEFDSHVGHPFVPVSQTEQYHLSNPNMAPTRPGTPEKKSSETLSRNILDAKSSLQQSLSQAFSSAWESTSLDQQTVPTVASSRRRGGYYGPPVDVYGVEQLGPDADKQAPANLSQSQLPPLARNLPTLDGVPADQVVACMRWPVGYSVAAECNPNTPNSIGRITIRHEPMFAPVLPGRYAICIQGLTPGSYSIGVSASVVFSARDVLEGAVRRVDKTSKRLPECRKELNDISQSFRLGQRKLHLVRDLVVKTEQELSTMSHRTAALRRALERGLVTRGDLGSDAEDDGLNFEEQFEIIGAGGRDGEYSSGFSSSASEPDSTASAENSSDEPESESNSEAGSISESDSDLSYSSGGSAASESSFADSGSEAQSATSASSSDESEATDDVADQGEINPQKLIDRQKRRGAKVTAGKAAAAALKQKGRARRAGADRAKLKRMREQMPVSEHVRQLILRQLTALDERFGHFVRLLNLREDELVQIEDGLQALHHASMARQHEMSQLLQRLREYKKHLPVALSAMKMKLGDPLDSDQGNQARISLSTKLGFGKGAQVPGQQEVDDIVHRAYTGINFNSSTASEIEYEAQKMAESGGIAATQPEPNAAASRDATGRSHHQSPAAECKDDKHPRTGAIGDTSGYNLEPCSEHDLNMLLYGPQIVKYMIEARKQASDTTALTPAQIVRRKPLHELTKEEKRWMSMDIILNPEAYADKMDDDSGDEWEDLVDNGVIVQQSGQQRTKKKLKLPKRTGAANAAMKMAGIDTDSQGAVQTPQKQLSDAAKETYLHKESVTTPYTAGALTSPSGDIDSDAPVAAGDVANLGDFDIDATGDSEARPQQSSSQHASKSAVFFALNKLQRNLPKCSLTRSELVRVLTVPFQQLNKQERETRKLLGKYHDNLSRVRANQEASGDGSINKAVQDDGKKSTLQQLYSIQEEEDDSGSDNEVKRGQKFKASQTSLGDLKVHVSSSAFMRAYAAVPIPQGAPMPLKALLQKRSQQLNSRWSNHMAKTLKGHEKAENANLKTLQDLKQSRLAPQADLSEIQSGADAEAKPSTVVQMVENVRGTMDVSKPISLNRVIDFSKAQQDVSQLDVDEVCRDLLEELDRSMATDAPYMESSVLHGTEQRYDTRVLIGELEEHLNRLLLAQVFERESIEAALIEEQRDMYRKAAANDANEQEKAIAADRKKAMERLEVLEAKRAEAALAELKSFDASVDLTDDEIRERAELAAAAAALVQQREELKARMEEKEMDFGDGDSSVSSLSVNSNAAVGAEYNLPADDPLLEIGALAKWGDPNKPITPRRAEKEKMQALIAREKARAAARNMAKGTAGSGGGANAVQRRRKAELLNLLQEGVLVADDDPDGIDFGVAGVKVRDTASKRLAPWKPSVPIESLKARLAVLNRELLRIRTTSTKEVETDVALSYLRGGNKKLERIDAIFELGMEIAEIKNSLRLNDLDKELHRGYTSTKEWMTTSVLHGTPQQVWRLNAIEALERQANRIVARQTAVGLIEDVLQWMLEGWHFGERKSRLAAQGFVPSLKVDGALRPSEGASKAAAQFVQEGPAARAMAMDAARGLIPAPEESPFDANVVAAEDMVGRDPRGDRFPFAHAAIQQDRAEQQMQMFLEQQQPRLQPIQEEDGSMIWPAGSELVQHASDGVLSAAVHGAGQQALAAGHPSTGSQQYPRLRPSSTAHQPSIRSGVVTASTNWNPGSVAVAMQQESPAQILSAEQQGWAAPAAVGLGATQTTLEMLGVQTQNPFISMPAPLVAGPSTHEQMIQQSAHLVAPSASQHSDSPDGVPDILKAMIADETSKGSQGVVGGDDRMPVEERWKNIHQAVAVRNAIRIAVKAYKKVDKTMDETEQTLKYGIFCMTLLYFRNMTQVKEQQQIMSGARDVAILEAGAGDVKIADSELTKERLKMRNSKKKCVERYQALNALHQIASAGYERKATRDRNRRFREHMQHVERERKMTSRRVSSVAIQRIYRGHLGRKFVNGIRAERLEAIEQAKREQVASVQLQAWYRGHLARQYVHTMRTEMAAFMSFLRREEDKELETVYFMDNPVERYKKKAKDLYQSRVKKRREMARKMQRNLEAEVIELEDGAIMDDMALKEAKEAAKDKEADPLENVNAKTLRTMGGDKTFFKLVTADDLKKQTKSRLVRENKALAAAQQQLRERAASAKSSKAAARLAAGQAASQ